jgi:hypothetical protein
LQGPAKISAAIVTSLFIVGILAVAAPIHAQVTPNWVNVVSTKDLTGNQVLKTTDPLVAGHVYNVTIEIEIPVSLPTAKFNVSLDKSMAANGTAFWFLDSQSYAGYNRSTFISGLRDVQFNQYVGNLFLSTIFRVPINLTTRQLSVTQNTGGEGTLTLHFEQVNFPLVTVDQIAAGSSGTVGWDYVSVSDQSIQTYLSTYQTASGLITGGSISTLYSTLLSQELSLAQTEYKLGLTDQATVLLQGVGPSTLPVPPSSSYVSYLLVAALLLAVIAAVLGILWLRSRSRGGFATGVINEINRQLASLEVVASRYDKNLADQLKNLREKLTEAS